MKLCVALAVGVLLLAATSANAGSSRPQQRLHKQYAADEPTPVGFWKSPPFIDQNFEAYVISQFVPWGRTDPADFAQMGQEQGAKVSDFQNLRELYVVNDTSYDVFVLRFYNASNPMQYTYINSGSTTWCKAEKLNDTWLSFNWLQYSSWTGQTVMDGLLCDVWAFQAEQSLATLYMYTFGPSAVPVRMVVQLGGETEGTSILDYYSYTPGVQPAGDFTIPPWCNTSK